MGRWLLKSIPKGTRLRGGRRGSPAGSSGERVAPHPGWGSGCLGLEPCFSRPLEVPLQPREHRLPPIQGPAPVMGAIARASHTDPAFCVPSSLGRPLPGGLGRSSFSDLCPEAPRAPCSQSPPDCFLPWPPQGRPTGSQGQAVTAQPPGAAVPAAPGALLCVCPHSSTVRGRAAREPAPRPAGAPVGGTLDTALHTLTKAALKPTGLRSQGLPVFWEHCVVRKMKR